MWLLCFERRVPGPYTPQVVGVVVSSEWTETNVVARYVLDNGKSFSAKILDKNETTIVYQAGNTVGDLLLAGSETDRPWLALLAPAGRSDLPADCYALHGFGTDEGEWVQTDIGLRLRKAPRFDPGLLPDTPDGPVPTTHPGLRYEAVQQTFCVNRDGLVTVRDWGTLSEVWRWGPGRQSAQSGNAGPGIAASRPPFLPILTSRGADTG